MQSMRGRKKVCFLHYNGDAQYYKFLTQDTWHSYYLIIRQRLFADIRIQSCYWSSYMPRFRDMGSQQWRLWKDDYFIMI